MLKVSAVEVGELPNLNQIIKAWGVTETLSNYSLIMKATENDTVLGLGILKFYPGGFAEIEKIILGVESDFEMEYVLGKGLLNFIDRRGIEEVYSTDFDNQNLLKVLKFKQVRSFPKIYENKTYVYHLNLKNYFISGQCVHEKQ